MMRRLCLLLVLLLLLGCLSGCAAKTPDKDPYDPQKDAVVPDQGNRQDGETGTDTPGPAPSVPEGDPLYLPDFTVRTISGGTFRLSEALKDHELVLINLFATWCGPCRMEFPYMMEALAQRSESVAAIVLSVDPEDTQEKLEQYVQDMKLTLPVSNGSDMDLVSYASNGIPTTLLVDREGKLAGVEVGAMTSAQDFLDLFDGFTGEDYDPGVCTYTVYVYDVATQEMISGAVVNFCTDTTCTPVAAGEDGAAVFTGPPARYHVEIISVPEGFVPYYVNEFTTEPYGETYYVPYMEAEG